VGNLNLKNAGTVLQSALTMGADPQSFISAPWILFLFNICPAPLKRGLALVVLSLSPHYFYRKVDPRYAKMPYWQFVEAEVDRNNAAREIIIDRILAPYLKPDSVVLDMGCGPGFLAKATAARVAKVFAADISKGVLESAKVIQAAPNVEYLYSGDIAGKIAPGSLDLIYSFAVIQHVTDDVYEGILETCRGVLKADGRIVFHVELESEAWKPEEAWRADESLAGKIKLQYALNCFGRKATYFSDAAARHGFKVVTLETILLITKDRFDDVCDGDLLVMEKV